MTVICSPNEAQKKIQKSSANREKLITTFSGKGGVAQERRLRTYCTLSLELQSKKYICGH